ncbi:Protein cps3 [Paramyrothecium foliicola]|nr:Protein cps3 [Paramyrothecium foliicola]
MSVLCVLDKDARHGVVPETSSRWPAGAACDHHHRRHHYHYAHHKSPTAVTSNATATATGTGHWILDTGNWKLELCLHPTRTSPPLSAKPPPSLFLLLRFESHRSTAASLRTSHRIASPRNISPFSRPAPADLDKPRTTSGPTLPNSPRRRRTTRTRHQKNYAAVETRNGFFFPSSATPPRPRYDTVTMPEYRHSRSGSLNIHAGQQPSSPSPAAAAAAAASGRAGFEGPRSPPTTTQTADQPLTGPFLDTSHVPCKFFRQGACQAGNACPFSHDLGTAAETVCKYFAKGNCKFGPKCANIHVLPDGRRINYGKNGVTVGASPINLVGRSGHSSGSPTSANYSTTSALTTSLYHADVPSYPAASRPFEDRPSPGPRHHLGRQPSLDNGIPAIDTPYSDPNSNYGSPRDEDASRLGFGLSPANGKGLSVLDAPLPASFDSNGISNAARFPAAPWPSSVPSKFGLESPTPSLSSVKDSRTSETLKLLHTSAFGSSDHLTPTASSPPSSHYANGIDEYFGKRAMHSSRFAKPRMLSSSLPKAATAASVDRDWEAEFAFGDDSGDNVPENYVPENLQDLLTPAEKARRGSMRAERPDTDFSIDGLSKYGSPIGSSPSRWGPLFQRQKEEEEAARSARAAGSVFGHVGSPLRNSTLAQEMGEGPSSTSRRLGNDSMSMLSQQLQRSRLDDNLGSSSPLLHPAAARIPNSGISPIGKDRGGMERHVSSGSISSSVTGRFTTPIDEEDPAFVFSMEEEEDPAAARMRKRGSAGLAMGGLSSYASAVSGKVAANGAKEARESLPLNGR